MSASLDRIAERFTQLLGQTAVPTRPPMPVSVATPAPAASAASPTPSPPGPIQRTDHALKGYDLNVAVSSRQVVLVAEILDQEGFALDAITGVGPRTRQRLLEHFGSVRAIGQAGPDALTAVVSAETAARIRKHFDGEADAG